MNIKQTLKSIVFSFGLAIGIVTLSGSLSGVSAAEKCSGTTDVVEKKIKSGECNKDGTVNTNYVPPAATGSSGSPTVQNSANTKPCTTGSTTAPGASASNCCGGVATSIIGCTQTGSDSDIEQTGLWGVLLLAINILSAGVGILAVAGIVYASIMYTTAGGNAEQTKKAIGIITNVVIGVVAFALMWGLLNFLIPGGLFG